MEIIKYKNNEIEIDVRFDYENNTVWLNLEQISYLFNKSKSTISRKLKELIKINNHSVVAEFATTANDNKVYKVSHYSMEIIVAIGYKTNSNEVMKFKKWVEEKNIFCNTLVDRIVTGYPKDEKIELGYEDNMLNTSELFHLWVIEGPKKILKELPFDKTGLNIIVTDSLEKYRTRKVRILNGAHTSMIPYAMLEGIETVKDCMENEKMFSFVKRCVFDEIIPTLDLPKEELVDYANNVFERFNNPYIRHLCASISLNSVSKFKVRVLPSLLEYIERKGQMPQNLIMSLAKLIEFYKYGTPTDDADIIKFMREKSLSEILANKAFWDTDLSFLYDEVAKYDN